MDTNYAALFEPTKIGRVEIKNRLAMAPMCVMGGTLVTPEGCFSPRAIEYYVERARGGIGLIIAADLQVENEIEKFKTPIFPRMPSNPLLFIATASELTERVHAYGAKIFLQMTAGFGHNAIPAMLDSEPVSPSPAPNYWDPTRMCRELTTQEVETIVQRFGDAAEAAVMAGFDGFDIHAMHEGYLLDSFTMAMFNQRTDKYGGDLRGRLTFPIEVLREIKRRAGDVPVQLRFSIKSYIKDWNQGALPGEVFEEKGRDVAESLAAASILQAAGYDAFNADAGSYEAWYWAHPPLYQEHGCYLPLAGLLKQSVSVPVLVAGKIDLPELAARAIEEHSADMVALGRALLADPYWPNKVLEGSVDQIRPCTGCYDGCLGREVAGRPLSCAVNPACGREQEYGIRSADQRKRVLVVGGGVAGMEAARVAATSGHTVTLFERRGMLGGHLIAGTVPGFKADTARLVEWYSQELRRLRVDVRLNSDVSVESLQDADAHVVILATGSRPLVPKNQCTAADKVVDATEVLTGARPTGNRVVVVGGGLVGCETALWLAQQGKAVSLVEMLPTLMSAGLSVPHPVKLMLLDLMAFHGVSISTDTKFLDATEQGAVVVTNGRNETTIPAETIVLALGLCANQDLFRALGGQYPNVHMIGDAIQPRNIMYAIWDAYEVTRNL
ncbi:FAD-dependent oxidoreductase [Chloroflexota bacterium]